MSGISTLVNAVFSNALLSIFISDDENETLLKLLALQNNKHPLKKKFTYLEVVSFGGLICLLFDHFLVLQDSFILGFAIPIISYLIRHIYPSEKIKSYLWRSLTIYLFFIPFEIIYYHKVVVMSFPLQVISTPLFLLIGIISLLCFFRIPIYAVDKGLIFLLKGYTGIIKDICPCCGRKEYEEINKISERITRIRR